MSKIKNTWVGYLNRSYQSIKNSLLSRVTNSNPEMTDHSESNIFVIIISMFAGIAEMLNYYVDNMAREAYMSIAIRRSSVIRHTYPLDYRIKVSSAETVEVVFSFFDGVNPYVLAADLVIPGGTIIESTTGITYRTLTDITLVAGESNYNVPFSQSEVVVNTLLGNTDGSKNQKINLPANYQQGTLELSISGVLYSNVESWAETNFESEAYIIEVGPDNTIFAELGNDTLGIVPQAGLEVRGTFYTTQGPAGAVKMDELTDAPIIAGMPAGVTLEVTNPLNSSGGTYIEEIEEIRSNAIYSRRANLRMVTEKDYESLLVAIAGISSAVMDFECGSTPTVYIAPTGGGISSTILISTAQDEVDEKRMVGCPVEVKAAGETYIFLKITATAKKSRDLVQTDLDIKNALLEFGNAVNQRVNNSVRISDVTCLIQDLDRVEYLDLDIIYAAPYAYPIDHTTQLVWDRAIEEGSVDTLDWYLEHNAGVISVIKNRTYMGQVNVGVEYSDDIVTFTVNAGAYNNGDRWTFKTYPYNKNINLTDFSMPRTSLDYLDITVNKLPV